MGARVEVDIDRRRFLELISALGLSLGGGSKLFARSDDHGTITKKNISKAEKLAGLEFSEAERELMLEDVGERLESYEKIRQVELANDVPPAFRFDPLPAGESLPGVPERRKGPRVEQVAQPRNLEDAAFWPLPNLASLIKSRQVSSTELTRMYLDRLERYGPVLECVITLTEDRALEQAARADREIAAGNYRGPLHGIPWGAKDLLSASEYPTTWGAVPFKDQSFTEDATVVKRLEAAGAVLAAKLTLGALAWGDVWYGGKTRNPWNLEQGSSGSSAGSAAAMAAGLVGFAIGSETWGSIVSPSTRCGVTGLRPTFGRVSRHGAMALSWTMDKLGPIGRTAEDCALVLEAIAGADGLDATAVNMPFIWSGEVDPAKLRIGYVKTLFDEPPEEDQEEWHALDLEALETLRGLGFELIPVELPDLPIDALSFILSVEAAAAFDELTRSGRDDLLVRQIRRAWPNAFRQARLIPAVEYVQANRVRTLLIQRMAELFTDIDVYVAPSFGGDNLLLNNLTGHPAVVAPNGFRKDGTPTSISFIGKLFGEEELVAVADAYQQATDFHLRQPNLDAEPSTV